MKCPYCSHLGAKVVDSRESKEGEIISRRRECLECGKRFTSYERIDEIPYMVVKKDGTRERFERQKLIAGLLKACEKRPVSVAALEGVADRVEATLQERPEKEMSTEEVGRLVMEELKRLDKVAYVRFASVYRHFRDIGEFMTELKDLINAKVWGEGGRGRGEVGSCEPASRRRTTETACAAARAHAVARQH